jgi:hypothetical protein
VCLRIESGTTRPIFTKTFANIIVWGPTKEEKEEEEEAAAAAEQQPAFRNTLSFPSS